MPRPFPPDVPRQQVAGGAGPARPAALGGLVYGGGWGSSTTSSAIHRRRCSVDTGTSPPRSRIRRCWRCSADCPVPGFCFRAVVDLADHEARDLIIRPLSSSRELVFQMVRSTRPRARRFRGIGDTSKDRPGTSALQVEGSDALEASKKPDRCPGPSSLIALARSDRLAEHST
jgi:hypothetical protein